MAYIVRFIIDGVFEEPPSERRIEIMSREITDNLHVLIAEKEDEVHTEVEKLAYGHVHDTAAGDRCGVCLEASMDYRSGDSVING